MCIQRTSFKTVSEMALLVSLGLLSLAISLVGSCPSCSKLPCPKTEVECPLGLIKDPCNCCPFGRCGLSLGQSCYNESLQDPELKKLGYCASSLHCEVAEVMDDDQYRLEGSCVCTESQLACGSDNQTYDNICFLNEAAASSGFSKSLILQHWGPCFKVPEIITGPEDIRAAIDQPVTLDCEVKGHPPPVVMWEFTGSDGFTKVLPSDDPLISIQVRGGPETQMATSWMQLVQLRPSYAGTYYCVANNEIGTSRAKAKVDIR